MRTRPLWTGVCTDTDTLETSLALSNQADDVDFVLEGNPLISVSVHFSSVQFSRSVMSNSLRPHGLQHSRPPCPSPTPGVYSNSSIESVMPSNHLILCCPLLLLPSIFPSIRVFSNESTLHIRWLKCWSFNLMHHPSNEYSGDFLSGMISLLSRGLSKVSSITTV